VTSTICSGTSCLLRSASTTRSEAEEVGDQYNRHPTPTRALLLPFLLVGSVGDGGGDDGEAGAMAFGGVLAAGWLPACCAAASQVGC
jgi:hypothetical protein